MTITNIQRLSIATLLIFFLAGCAVSIDSSERIHHATWDPQSLSQIERGVTSSNQLLRIMGEPSSRTDSADGAEIWLFENHSSKNNRLSILFLLHAQSSKDVISQLNIEVQDGTVSDYWIARH